MAKDPARTCSVPLTSSLLLPGLVILGACSSNGARPEAVPSPPSACRQANAAVLSAGLRWTEGYPTPESREMAEWCVAVGPPLAGHPGSIERFTPISVDSLVVVSWNIHLGRGDLGRFLDDLRSGAYTAGHPVDTFVLLLQEAIRGGADVPVGVSGRGGKRIEAELDGIDVLSIGDEAEALGLHYLYVPSMRNGRPDGDDSPEDRGNAILSTLPLSEMEAIVLPLARQRRVAVAATVDLIDSTGAPWGLRLFNAHLGLESLTGFPGVGRATRLRQVEAILAASDPSVPSVFAGDLNSWSGGPEEPAVRRVARRFDRPTPKAIGTHHVPFLFDRVLDYILFDVPERWEVDYVVVKDRYGSDHRPLVGWVRRPASGPEDSEPLL